MISASIRHISPHTIILLVILTAVAVVAGMLIAYFVSTAYTASIQPATPKPMLTYNGQLAGTPTGYDWTWANVLWKDAHS